MIPQRVKLRGFLCYKDEQSIDFDGNATLWMLSGLNGSGKSAIFDAVTYALFGHHRGGGTGAYELINKDSDTLLVEFDFLLDGKAYRAKRTLKRDTKGGARGTQQMFWLSGDDWVAVPDTGQKREFDRWVEENIGLSYETFTSSVLLLQGKAERLLDSKPEGRREVLASIVDLGRYERLHAKADEKRKALDGERKALEGRLAVLPVVEPLEVEEARNHIAEAEAARAAARDQVERLLGIEATVRAWQDTRQRLAQAKSRWERARGVLAEAASIEQAVERLRELREVLPRFKEISVLRGQVNGADEQTRFHTREREKQADELAKKDAALRQARDNRATLQGQVVRDTDARGEVMTKLRALSLQLAALQECERQEGELARLRDELRRLPADPAEVVRQARAECDRLDAVERVVPVLQRFVSRRDELTRAAEQEVAAEERMRLVRERGEARKAEVEGLAPRVEEAAGQLELASAAATEARTLLTQAKQSLAEVQQLDGAKMCRHCGQPLTANHIEDEKRRRSKAVKEAESAAKQTAAALEMTRRNEADLRQRYGAAKEAYEAARVEYADSSRQCKAARAGVERGQQECAHVWEELPLEQRTRICPAPVADWRATTYPAAKDLDALRVQARGLAPARRKLADAEQVWQQHGQLRARESQAQENLARLLRDLPPDRDRLRGEHADLEAREKSLLKSIDAVRRQVGEAEKEIDRLTREREQAQSALAQVEVKLKEEQLRRDNAERGIAGQIRLLPPAWQAQAPAVGFKEVHTLSGELAHLEGEGTDDRGRDLEQARLNAHLLEQDVRQLEKQEAAFPPEAREDAGSIAARLTEARRADRQRDEELSAARHRLALLETQRAQREQILKEQRAVEKELSIQRTLCELLGKDRLQLYLVRQAERQVVEYANAVLDRLSGGQLYLKLSGEANGDGASAKALDLEAYNRVTGERPINVAFLSGSQKFRVAVSLALGIGQYASRRHRPIESVIIDEGFGCLDSQGRQVMIQELQNLRSQMRCILLVSHQEDFAEAFSDGYQFKLENGATRVRRFQK